jgi:hypothetical protein
LKNVFNCHQEKFKPCKLWKKGGSTSSNNTKQGHNSNAKGNITMAWRNRYLNNTMAKNNSPKGSSSTKVRSNDAKWRQKNNNLKARSSTKATTKKQKWQEKKEKEIWGPSVSLDPFIKQQQWIWCFAYSGEKPTTYFNGEKRLIGIDHHKRKRLLSFTPGMMIAPLV